MKQGLCTEFHCACVRCAGSLICQAFAQHPGLGGNLRSGQILKQKHNVQHTSDAIQRPTTIHNSKTSKLIS